MSKTFRNQVFKRIIDLGKVTKAEVDDLVRIWRVGTGDEKAITLANFVKTVDEDLGSGGLTLTEIVTLIEEEIAELGGVYVPLTRQLTINGVTQDLSTNRTFTIPTHAPVTLATPSNGLTLVGQQLGLGLASSGVTGALSGTDWDTFNGKIGGSGSVNYVPKFTGAGTIGGSQIFDNGTSVSIGTTSTTHIFQIDVKNSNYLGSRIFGTNNVQLLLESTQKRQNLFSVKNISKQYSFGLNSDIDNSFIFFDNTVGLERMRISGSGKVGIAIASPTETLDVNGTTRIRTINNLGTSATVVLTKSATGVISERTVGEFRADLGLDASYQRDVFTYVATNVFTLTQTPLAGLEVYINGQKKRYGVDYTVSGTTLIISTTEVDLPSYASAEIEAVYYYSLVGITPAVYTGSGTTDFLTRWTGSNQFGVSLIQDNGSVITLPASTDIPALAGTTNTDKFMVLDVNRIKFRTGAQLLSDIGAQAAGSYANAVHTHAIGDVTGLQTALDLKVPTTRTLTINGQTFDLSENRSWTIETGGGFDAVHDNGNNGTFDLSNGLTQKIVLNGNKTFVFTNPTSGDRYEILIHQDATGNRTVTWPELHWRDRQVPTVSTAANAKDKLVMTYDGFVYWAELLKDYGLVAVEGAIVTTNLAMHWDAGNSSSYSGTGTNIDDLTANNYDGTLNGATYSSSDGGKFTLVKSSGNWINSIGTTTGSAAIGTSNFSIEIWCKPANINQSGYLFSNRSNSSGDRFSIHLGTVVFGASFTNSKKVSLVVYKNSVGFFKELYITDDVVDGNWKQIVVTRNSDTLLMYVNGVLKSTTSVRNAGSGTQNLTTDRTWRIGDDGSGAGSSSFSIDSDISITRLYNKELTAAEVLQNFNAQKVRYGL